MMRKPELRKRRSGFTIVELLGVILVIVILMGLVFRLASLAIQKSERGRAVQDLEALKQAVESYYAEYGVYPPTMRTIWEDHATDPILPPPDYGYKTGLYWYLMVGPSHEKWDYLLKSVGKSGGQRAKEADDVVPSDTPWAPPVDLYWTNSVRNFQDPWGQGYSYRVGTNFQSYRLWSLGPPSMGQPVGDDGYVD